MKLACVLLLALLSASAQAQLQGLRQRTFCTSSARPSSPRNIQTVGGNGRIDISWSAPSPTSNACVGGYLIRAGRVDGVGKTNEWNVTNGDTKTFIENVANGSPYNITVQAYNAKFAGPVAFVLATPTGVPAPAAPARWSCTPEPKSYPLCPAAEAGLCAPLSCARLASMGLCNASWMRVTSWENKTITQHCADVCGCPTTPLLRTNMMEPTPDRCCAIEVADYYTKA